MARLKTFLTFGRVGLKYVSHDTAENIYGFYFHHITQKVQILTHKSLLVHPHHQKLIHVPLATTKSADSFDFIY